MDVLHQFPKPCDGSFEQFFLREVDVVVSLHTDTIDRHASILHFLDHIINALTLARIHTAVVVVNEYGIRVSFTCESESLCNKFVATKFEGS